MLDSIVAGIPQPIVAGILQPKAVVLMKENKGQAQIIC